MNLKHYFRAYVDGLATQEFKWLTLQEAKELNKTLTNKIWKRWQNK